MTVASDAVLSDVLGGARALLVDLDGVLVDTAPAIARLWSDFSREFCSSRSVPLSMYEGLAIEATIEALLPGAEPDTVAECLAFVRDAEPALHGDPVPGARELLEAAHDQELPVVIVTGASRERARAALARLGASTLVHDYVTREDAPGKPDPAPYALAAQRAGFGAAACVAIEDSVAGVVSAARAGVPTVGYLDPSLANSGAACVASALSEVRAGIETRTSRRLDGQVA